MPDNQLRELIGFQKKVRSAFDWDYRDDLKSAKEIESIFTMKSPYGIDQWSGQFRNHTLENICKELNDAPRVLILGAAIKAQDIIELEKEDVAMIVADGAVGAINNFEKLICIVSDLDGNPHLDRAALESQRFIIHAHGDNITRWKDSMEKWSNLPSPPEIVLSHQTDDELQDMYNFGGFTDGDRAVCFALWAGVNIDKIELFGFSTTHVGEWSGSTDKKMKMKKLAWMHRILSFIGLGDQVEN
jgi:uncharacterized Rossmann fold enzyme